jgi:hypothetical protein
MRAGQAPIRSGVGRAPFTPGLAAAAFASAFRRVVRSRRDVAPDPADR